MKAIVIDAKYRKVKEVTLGEGIDDYYKHLDCRCFTVVATPSGDVFVDDEGMYRQDDHGFVIQGYHSPLRGNGVMVGAPNGEGESQDVEMTVADVISIVQFFGGE